MSGIGLLLGPIVFQDFEIPSGVNFGGRQRIALYRLPGGSRVIDALGRDDAQISFSGIFAGPSATLRARSLDELRVAGAALPLTWDVLFYTVLISEFRADYRTSWWIPYRIVCTVLQDEASTLTQGTASLTAATLSDIGTAAGYASNTGVDLSLLQAAISAPGATTRGTAAYTAAQSCIRGTRSSIGSSIDDATATLTDMSGVSSGSAEAGAANLSVATDTAGELSSLVSADAYIRRAAANLADAST